MTEFLGALFYPLAKHCEPAGKIELPKYLSQNAPVSMCVSVKTALIFVIELFLY